MSKGLGKQERRLLHYLYHAPNIAPSGRRYMTPGDLAASPSEYSSLQRAGRALGRKNLARLPNSGYANDLEPLTVEPYFQCDICTPEEPGISVH